MICDECKRTNGTTCCEVLVGAVPTMPLSLPEVHRITAVTGLKPEAFTVMERIDPTEMAGLISMSPITRSLLVRDTIVRLKTTPSHMGETVNSCVFLGEKGCTLDKSVRPLGCRLFPFTYNPLVAERTGGRGGLVRLPTEPECLAAERESSDDDKLATSLGMTRTELITIGGIREVEAAEHYDLMTRA